MKQIFLFIFTAVLLVFAQNNLGIPATIELISGTSKNVIFLGADSVNVNVGGHINGQFTAIKIPKDRVKSLKDTSGIDLLQERAIIDTIPANNSNTLEDSTAAETKDSLILNSEILVTDSIQNDSIKASPTFLDSVNGQHIFVSFERRSSDSLFSYELSNLIIRLLKESGTPLKTLNFKDFGECKNSACIKDSLFRHKAASVYLGRITSAVDSFTVEMSRYFLDDSLQKNAKYSQLKLSAMHAISDALKKNKLHNFIAKIQDSKIIKEQKGKSYIHIETDPEDAIIGIFGKNDICKSPCTFAVTDTQKVTLFAHWNVGQQLWANRATISPIENDTAKISLKLKRTQSELRVITYPENAEIYGGSQPISVKSNPLGISPNRFLISEPGFSTIQIRKKGYKDTLVTLYTPPTEITQTEIHLTPLTDLQQQKEQEEWYKERRKIFIGKTLMGSSIAPFLIGALFTYLAFEDYHDANKIKQELSTPNAGGSNYQAKRRENKDLVNKGDQKVTVGVSLLGIGAALLGVGFALSF